MVRHLSFVSLMLFQVWIMEGKCVCSAVRWTSGDVDIIVTCPSELALENQTH